MGFWRGPIQFASKILHNIVTGVDEHVQMVYTPGSDIESDKQTSGNVREKWKVGFANLTQLSDNFHEVTKAATDLVMCDGNVAGSNWLDICNDAVTPNTQTVYLSKKAFKVPYVLEHGFGLSQRIGGQDYYLEMVGVNADKDGNVLNASDVISSSTLPADNDVTAITVAFNVWSVTLSSQTNTYIRVGDWVCIYGCADNRLNVGRVIVTAISSSVNNLITFTSTLADGTYTPGVTGGKLRVVCPCGLADYHHAINLYGTTANNADTVSRNGAVDPTGQYARARVVNWNPGNSQTDSAIPNEGGVNYTGLGFTRPFRAKGQWRTEHLTGSLQWIAKDQDSTTVVRSTSFRESEVPAQDQWYALRIRSIVLPNSATIAGTDRAITAISKAGSTTWTVTCPGHGLTTNSRVRIYGVRDQTGFPNVTTDTVVASVVNADTFTIVSTTGTATSYGGVVVVAQGGNVPTYQATVVSTFNKTYDGLRLLITGNASWTEVTGNIVSLFGLVNSSNVVQTALHGRYRVARLSTTTIELEPMDGQEAAIAAISGSTNSGGAIVRNTSFRIHYTRIIDYVRMLVEPACPTNTGARSMPVYVNGGNLGTQVVSVSQIEGVAIGSQVKHGGTNRSLPVHFSGPVANSDVTSSARTATGNSGVISDENGGGNVGATLTVTANSGTNQTLDVSLEESWDNGATWVSIWNFERFTTTNTTAWMPSIPIGGRRRWVWTIGGSSPSFTFKIDTIRSYGTALPIMRQYFDRTAGVIGGTATSATGAFNVASCWAISATITCSAVTSGAVYNIQVSNDGINWATASGDVTAIAGTIVIPATTNILARFARIYVKTGGTQTGTVATLSGSN